MKQIWVDTEGAWERQRELREDFDYIHNGGSRRDGIGLFLLGAVWFVLTWLVWGGFNG